jgi:hypothetical protein
MKHFALLFLAAIFPIGVQAQAACPADVKAIPFHWVNQHQMIVGVSINHSGPYDFLLDTGTQVTVVDLRLAADLRLKSSGPATVAGASFQGPALYAKLDRFQVGDHVATNQAVLVYNMKTVQAEGFALRGLLGEDFLSRYDVLIDKAHNVLCIDDTGAMVGSMKGEHLSQAPSAPPVVLVAPVSSHPKR